MENKETTSLPRRSLLGGLLALVATTATAAPVSQLVTPEKGGKSLKRTAPGNTPAEILSHARLALGIENAADVTASTSSKIRVADSILASMSDSELDEAGQEMIIQAAGIVIGLRETNAYSQQSQVDMKFLYIPVDQEIKNTISSLKDKSIDVASAQLAIRTVIGNMLDGLEQVPTI